MLTVDFDRLDIGHGAKVIDVGCGAGRHSFEAYRRGADVIALLRHCLGDPGTCGGRCCDARRADTGAQGRGRLAVTVPRWLPERLCWLLSDDYHSNDGGHIRIYRAHRLRAKIANRGMTFVHAHHSHALHAPFWWLKCLVGVDNSEHLAVIAYHKMLVWDMLQQPKLTRLTESTLNPLIGKSVALYFEKPEHGR